MELGVLMGLFGLGIILWLALTRARPFVPPAVSPLSQDALSAFEAAPSLWVNASERAFYTALMRHLPRGFSVHGKVRLEDIIRVRRDVPEKLRWSLRGRVKSRHVDFLIIDRAGRPVLAIELDGVSHNAHKPSNADTVKSALFAAARLPLRRVRVGADFHHIAAIISTQLSAS